ncbi:unnamed protein product [Rotaria socialis]|uniref:Uncharacterized protein n=1 Tax=Rotaria socialis TaxID=392032 RepID=A0A818N2K2_9BILA|nr:unnamed protein product [Rotaria socialis]CAF3598941.1 unnamed protein product [Rotaria socialis]CAF3805222.1 unnamed protein product [Rotaria socialis]CAF4508582.1 unnamed protein product [Rotaria socialis]CAF4658917.1 unnamed protein product [Rotaria socialis]
MAHNTSPNGINNNNRRISSMLAPTNNQMTQNPYDVELMQLMEQERQSVAAQQQLQRANMAAKQQQQQQYQYLPYTNEMYSDVQSQSAAQINRRILPTSKPLRIIIIRHAERADAVLGSDWSKKSFDRAGRYIRFSEHLPDSLPTRSYLHHYVIDVPLTNRGRMHAFKTGKALLFNGYVADICYTSPSLRCVQSADGILNGMNRKNVPMQLEPGLFECYLNDFKRTLCFMTKDELAANGYNIEKSYQSLMPFMRPHDSQLDYYERCRGIMDVITERHQATGGTVLIVAHAPSLEGLTRHLSGGKLQPEKLFDIARRVPFLAMTIVEKNGIDRPWLFRTQPLQTSTTQSMLEVALELAKPPTPVPAAIPPHHHPVPQLKQLPIPPPPPAPPSSIKMIPAQSQQEQDQQRLQQTQNLRIRVPTGPIPMDPKKVVKSSTAPNLPTSNSLSEMFRVI